MSFKNLTSEEKRSLILRRMGIGCFICSFLVIFAMYVTSLPQIRAHLSEINAWFTRIELFIARYDKLNAVAIILFFFLVKTFVGFIPFSVLFIGTGLVFSPPMGYSGGKGGTAHGEKQHHSHRGAGGPRKDRPAG